MYELDDELAYERPDKHSGMGIASFALSIFAGVILISTIMYAGYLEVSTPGGIDEKSDVVMLIGVVVLGSGMMNLLAFGLGVAAVCQRDQKKVFAILGIVFSCVMVLTLGILLVIGTMVEQHEIALPQNEYSQPFYFE